MIVAVWIVLSGVGLLFSAADAWSAFTRWQLAQVAAPDDDRLMDLARSTMLSQLANVVLFALFVAIGLLAATGYLVGETFQWLMISANVVLVVSAIQEHRFRRRIYRNG